MANQDQSGEIRIPKGLQPPAAGSREKFGRLGVWAHQRAAIIADNDPVKCRRLGMEVLADKVQQDQNRKLREMEQVVDRVWESEIGKIWQIADRVDQQLLKKQLRGLAELQARTESPEWLALEGVMNMLGELRDWGEGR